MVAVSCLALLTTSGGWLWWLYDVENNANHAVLAVPQIRENTATIHDIGMRVQMLEERRADDARAMREMRGEINGQLEKLDSKIDHVGDKIDQLMMRR